MGDSFDLDALLDAEAAKASKSGGFNLDALLDDEVRKNREMSHPLPKPHKGGDVIGHFATQSYPRHKAANKVATGQPLTEADRKNLLHGKRIEPPVGRLAMALDVGEIKQIIQESRPDAVFSKNDKGEEIATIDGKVYTLNAEALPSRISPMPLRVSASAVV